MSKNYVSKLYDAIHTEWLKAKSFRDSTEPESHENGFYQGMEWAYNKTLDEIISIDMVENDGMTPKEAAELLSEMEDN